MASSNSNYLLYKGGSGFLIAYLLNMYVNKEGDTQRNLYFAGSSAAGLIAGSFVGDIVGNSLGSLIPSVSGVESGTTLLERIVEIGTSSATGFFFNKYVVKNDFNSSRFMSNLGVIAATDVLSEYVTDYLLNQPLNYLD